MVMACSIAIIFLPVVPPFSTPAFEVHAASDWRIQRGVCVCLLLQYLIQSCGRGGRRIVEDMYYEIRRAEACVD